MKMIVLENVFRQRIRKLLIEGILEDLISANPKLKNEIERLDSNLNAEMKPEKVPQYLKWFVKTRNAGTNREPIEDIIGDLIYFENNKQKFKSKGKSPDIFSYKSVDDIRLISNELDPKTNKQFLEQSKKDADIVYESDEWLVVFPKSTEASIAWAFDGKTTWCTAKKAGTNMFCNYTTKRNDAWVNLYYAIRKNPKSDSEDYVSLGYKIDGNSVKLDATGDYGGLTVDSKNKGLKKSDLKRIFDNEFDSITSTCQKHSTIVQSQGQHPQQETLQKAASDINVFNKMWSSYDPKDKSKAGIEAKTDFIKSILIYNDNINKTVMNKISDIAISNNLSSVYQFILQQNSTSPEIVQKISDIAISNNLSSVYEFILQNKNTSPEIVQKISDIALSDDLSYLYMFISQHKNTSPEIIQKISGKIKYADSIRSMLLKNNKISKTTMHEIFDIALSNNLSSVYINFLRHDGVTPEIVRKISDIALSDDLSYLYTYILEHKDELPSEITYKILSKADLECDWTLQFAEDPNTPSNILRIFASNIDNCADEAVFGESDVDKRMMLNALIKNKNTPSDLLASLKKMLSELPEPGLGHENEEE